MPFLVIAESIQGRPAPQAFELLAMARRLAPLDKIDAAYMGDGDAAGALFSGGADRVFLLDGTDAAGSYESDRWLAGLQQVLAKCAPRLILAGHTTLGADLAPRLAYRLELAIATGCERIGIVDREIHATRPCFGHRAREVIALRSVPAVATVRARSAEPLLPDSARTGETVSIALTPLAAAPRIISRQIDKPEEGPSLENARVIVAGGRGVGGPEGFQPLQRLAQALDGAVGASRVACDLGWCPRSWQIGLTGKTVTPNLYVAVGISGASHHMAGCGNAKNIVAINSDPEASIFKDARFGVIGDFRELVPALVEELARRKEPANV
jgi:electron transfer flavoprotein alpha subunit